MKNLTQRIVRTLRTPTATTDASDVVTTIADMGGVAQNATAIISCDYAAAPVYELTFWTSSSDTAGVTGTLQTETDNTVQVKIVSDNDGMEAWTASNVAYTSLAVSDYGIATLGTADVTVAVELPNIRRYVYAQYSSFGTGEHLGITLIGKDLNGDDTAIAAY